MDEKKGGHLVPVRQWIAPDYWPEFHCLAAACHRTCCGGGWSIRFSREDYLKIKHAEKSPALAELTVGSMHRSALSDHPRQYAAFKLTETGDCPFQREDGLCALQCECGEEVLPAVCREFPRAMDSWLTGYFHKCCSIGCEAVLHLLWERRDGLGFIDGPLEPSEEKRLRVADYSQELLAEYPAIWELCIDMLQDRRMRLSRRIIALGVLTKNLVAHHQETDAKWIGWAAVQREALESVYPTLEDLPGNKVWFVGSNLRWVTIYLSQRASNQALCEQIIHAVSDPPTRTYLALEQTFQETFDDLDWFFENILVNEYFLFGMPLGHQSPSDAWRSYLKICATYSILRFCAVAAQPKNQLELIDVLTTVGRALYHDRVMLDSFVVDMEKNHSDTLATAAILAGD